MRVYPASDDDAARSATERLGVFGGSFDPIHIGHLLAAREVRERLGLDRILIIPAALPPHKPDAELAPGSLRMRMIRAAVDGDPTFAPLDIELRREGVSWTVDTLLELREARPNAELFLILGSDQWRGFGGWREPDEIGRISDIVVMTRGGEEAVDAGAASLPNGGPPCTPVTVPRLDISSTGIRERVREGRSIRYMVPDEVRRIIEAAKLYL